MTDFVDFTAEDILKEHKCVLCTDSSHFTVRVVSSFLPTFVVCIHCIERMRETMLNNLEIEGQRRI